MVRLDRDNQFSEIKYREKTQVLYDAHGNYLQSVAAQRSADNSKWSEISKAEWKYNDNEELIWTASYSYRKQQNDWFAEDRYERLISNDTIVEVDFRNQNDGLIPVRKHFSLKNETGEVYHYETMIWNDTINEWEKSYLSKTFYINDTTVVSRENYVWDENQWRNKDKEAYELDQNNEKTGNFTLYQAASNGNWRPQSRFEEIKFSEEKKTFSNTYQWSSTDQVWVLYSQVQVYCNEDDQVQDVLLLELDTGSNQLMLRGEQMQLYDQHGRIRLVQDISHQDGIVTGTQHSIKYDEDGNIYREDHYEFDAENDTWKDIRSTEFFFDKDVILGTDEGQGVMDFFLLSEHAYASKRYAVKNVKIYEVEGEKKVLSGEYDYFYSQMLSTSNKH